MLYKGLGANKGLRGAYLSLDDPDDNLKAWVDKYYPESGNNPKSDKMGGTEGSDSSEHSLESKPKQKQGATSNILATLLSASL